MQLSTRLAAKLVLSTDCVCTCMMWFSVLQHGFTPLHLAVDNNHVQLAKLLLDKGATPDAADSVSA